MKRKDALCRLPIGKIKEQGTKRGRSLRILHQPEKDSPGYAALHGLPKATDTPDDELTLLLSTVALLELVEIGSIL
jgi:hypothetical protein